MTWRLMVVNPRGFTGTVMYSQWVNVSKKHQLNSGMIKKHTYNQDLAQEITSHMRGIPQSRHAWLIIDPKRNTISVEAKDLFSEWEVKWNNNSNAVSRAVEEMRRYIRSGGEFNE